MVSVDGSIVVQIVNFLLLIWILNMVFYKPVREILAKRKKKVYGLKSDLDTCGQAVEDKNNAYNAGIKEARVNGQKQKESLVEIAAGEEVKIIDEINKSAQAELEETKIKIKAEIDSVKRQLEVDVDVFAKAIGQKILGRII